MANSIINADSEGLKSTGGDGNTLILQTGGNAAITVNSTQVVTLAAPLPVASGGTGSNTGSGATLTNLNASAISSGTIGNAYTTGSSSNGSSTLVLRDASGNFSSNNVTAVNFKTTNWTITESGGVLYFAYGGTNKAKLDSNGNFTTVNNVTAYGSV